MRRALPLLLLLALLTGACGAESDPQPSGAEQAAIATPSQQEVEAAQKAEAPVIPAERVPLAIRRQLERGEVGLLDAFGQTRIRPETVDFAQDASLQDVTWSSWGTDGGQGSGTMRVQECDPTCAAGQVKTVRATIVLTAARECNGQRYFASSEVRPEAGEAPRSYVRAPC
jgi:hypothetical protein